jgi:hypothetical protein
MAKISQRLTATFVGATVSLTFITNFQAAKAITLESATLGFLEPSREKANIALADFQFVGWRFQISETLQVTDIGGRFGGGVKELPIFGTIVPLSNPKAFPEGLPTELESVSLASTVFSPINKDNNPNGVVFLTPLSVTLTPGDYSLIFGGGLFGSPRGGGSSLIISDDQKNLPGTSYFFTNDFSPDGILVPNMLFPWRELTETPRDLYFVIKGNSVISTSIPETNSTLPLLALGFLGATSILKKYKQRQIDLN